MDSQRWQQIKSLLADCLALPPEDQAPAARRLSSGDAELQEELLSLLAAEAEGGHAIDTMPAALALDALAGLGSLRWTGRRLGPYRIVAPLGQGGMGQVYRAERVDGQYEQAVAVKVMRPDLPPQALLERFRAERQILAGLDHPNLAKLLDGGVSDDGLPYFVMELVEGEPLLAYCERLELDIEARLRLFRTICKVVHHAHQRGVVHRDLKPDNLLVTGAGQVKLVDFGIAKQLATAPGPAAPRTATVLRALTPEYASPEQLRGEPVTPASDVYSLGVVLYRLLVSASPYGSATRDPYALSQAICESEPVPPSRALPATGPQARQRRRRLSGDLDAVVLMALRKQPAHRYASAEALADDLFRHLEGLPVQARRGAWSYRAGRFALRHRAMLGAAVLANLALAAGAVVASYAAYEARQQQQRAERHFASVRQLARALVREVHPAIAPLPGSGPARRLIVEQALNYLGQLQAEASDDPTLQLELAAGYRRVGDLQAAEPPASLPELQAALASYRRGLALLAPLVDGPVATQAPARREQAALEQRQAALLARLAGSASPLPDLAASPAPAPP
ncbi:serine/threonine-protein kinase [Eleftheria terrae]|uniref:serine/threonine-protein kinase n=1 Tax=Eleftheria terrae TaxID=1597781 RepID=UPI00263A95C7|nr:serine/threonine-protein kinase [Eleftheria terrae]WKB55863.1 serine/threonine protein kinase [Eleftheria terrae]